MLCGVMQPKVASWPSNPGHSKMALPWNLPPQPQMLRSAHSRIKDARRGASCSTEAAQICLLGPTKEIMGPSFSRNPRPLG